jgi:hypothetical protein
MRVSIWPGGGQPYGEVLEVARHAADTGWDGVYIADHFMPNAGTGRRPDHPTLECGSLIAALGAVVPRVRIGSLVYGDRRVGGAAGGHDRRVPRDRAGRVDRPGRHAR